MAKQSSSEAIIDPQIENSFKKFTELGSQFDFSQTINEAQTRLNLIDTILFDCLGWDSVLDVKVEDPVDNGYRDYTLSTNRKIAVVEAKKMGLYFELPKTDSKPKAVAIKSLLTKNDNLAKAVKQAASYSQLSGIPYTIITNGVQFVGFLGSRDDGKSPLEGRAIVFSSLEQIEKYFQTFWNLFSKEGIQTHLLKEELLSSGEVALPPKLSSSTINYPGARRRNDLQTDLQIVSELILEDLLHDDLEAEFLDECYCESGALSQYSLLARDIVNVRYFQENDDSIVNIQRINLRSGVNPEFFSNALSRRPVILLGDVGVGKTTFIRHLIQTDPDGTFKKGLAIYVNLGNRLILVENIVEAITKEIQGILQNEYSIDINADEFVRKTYDAELKLFAKSINQSLPKDKFLIKEIDYLGDLIIDKASHLRRAIEYLAKSGKNTTIFLDNIDQRSTDDQQAVYLVSQELASQTPAVVFVSLRPETFYRSSESGVLKAYHQRAFTIDPPRIDQVLLKRLEFGLKLAQGKITIPRLAQYGTNKLELLSAMLESMIASISGHTGRQRELITFIDNFASGNVRSAVDMVKGFLSSGHVNSTKITNIQINEPDYLVPLHEFLKAIIFGESEYYEPNASPINNVFDINTGDPKEYFLKMIFIRLLASYSEGASSNKGFVRTSMLYEGLQSLGFTAEQVDFCFYYCLNNELIESSINYVINEAIYPNQVRVTTKGLCYIKLLIPRFQYVDAMLVDTPIIDKKVRSYLSSNQDADIKTRLNRSAHFVSYLAKIYDKEIRPKNETILDSFWDDLYGKLERDITYIYERQVPSEDNKSNDG